MEGAHRDRDVALKLRENSYHWEEVREVHKTSVVDGLAEVANCLSTELGKGEIVIDCPYLRVEYY